jgi:hypothetical protein
MMPNRVASQTLRVKVIESATPTKAKPVSQSQERRGGPKDNASSPLQQTRA